MVRGTTSTHPDLLHASDEEASSTSPFQGIANSQSNLMLDKLHQMQLAEMAAKGVNETAKRHHGGHGMRLAEAVEVGRGERGLSTTHQASHHDLSLELTDGTANAAAAATLEDAAAHAEEASATPARNSGGVGTAAVRRSGRKQKAGRPAEGGT